MLNLGFGLGIADANSLRATPRTSMRAYFDPRFVSVTAGVVTSAPNLAGGADFLPLGTAPAWSLTAFSGKPGLNYDGITEKRLSATLTSPGLTGPVTMIVALAPGHNGVEITAVHGTDVAEGLQVFADSADPAAYAARTDNSGTALGAVADTVPTAIYTGLYDSVGAVVNIRVNGAVQSSPAAGAFGTMSDMTALIIGGQSNAQDTANGAFVPQGQIGVVFVFAELLSGATLDYYERYAGQVGGLSW